MVRLLAQATAADMSGAMGADSSTWSPDMDAMGADSSTWTPDMDDIARVAQLKAEGRTDEEIAAIMAAENGVTLPEDFDVEQWLDAANIDTDEWVNDFTAELGIDLDEVKSAHAKICHAIEQVQGQANAW